MPAVAELPILTALACLIVALALTVMVIYVVRGFFGVTGSTLGKLPVVGGWIDATGHHIEQRITNQLGQVVIKLEAGIGAAWHWQARIVDWLGREIARHANLLTLIASLLFPIGAIAGLIRSVSQAGTLIHKLVRQIEGIGQDVAALPRVISHGIGADVLPRIRSVEREAARDLGRERARAKSAERTAEQEITNLWKWTKTHGLRAGTRPFYLAVAGALTWLGLDWIKCNTAKSFFKRRGCNAWNDLEALLVVGEVIGLVSLVELAREEQKVVGFVATAVRDVLEV